METPSASAVGPRPEIGLRVLFEGLPSDLLVRALTHSSWTDECTGSYERLEFLGDSVLGLAVATALHQRFPEAEEGTLAKLKAFVVSRRSCGVVARRLRLDDLVLERAPGTEEQRRELVASATSMGNVLEALIGAAYLSRGFDTVCGAVVDAFADRVAYGVNSYVDYKSTLQELLAPSGRTVEYCLVQTEGLPHNRVFTSEVVVQGTVVGRGVGRSIKKSEQRAAHAALLGMGVATPTGASTPSGQGPTS